MADPTDVAAFYGRWAGLYDLLATRTPGIDAIRAWAVDALDLAAGETVLEVGCGTGANLPLLRERVGPGGRVVGIDVSPGALARARARVDRAGWRNVAVVRADGAAPPIRSADAVLGTFVVGMFEAPATVVAGWCDLVEPGGRVVLLDAAPRDRAGPLDAGFRLFVAASTPPSAKLRYDDSPAARLGARVDAARRALAERGAVDRSTRRLGGFLRLDAATVR